MQIITWILVVIHLIGLAVLIGPTLALLPSARKGRGFVPEMMFHGIAVIFVSGIFLIAISLAQGEVKNVGTLALKIIVMLAIVVMVLTKRKQNDIKPAFYSFILALTTLNIALSVMPS